MRFASLNALEASLCVAPTRRLFLHLQHALGKKWTRHTLRMVVFVFFAMQDNEGALSPRDIRLLKEATLQRLPRLVDADHEATARLIGKLTPPGENDLFLRPSNCPYERLQCPMWSRGHAVILV